MKRSFSLEWVLLLLVFLSGCGSSSNAVERAKTEDEKQQISQKVRVYYGTDRKPSEEADAGAELFSNQRNGQGFSYGISDVILPNDRKLGELLRPSLWRLEFGEKRGKHVVMEQTSHLRREQFFANMKNLLAQKKNPEVFVFVHGYNVTFAEAALRTAQMATDMKFDGVAILYSWPSQGSVSGYPADEGTVEWTQPHLVAFLNDLRTLTGAQSIQVIAHSMGNRPAVRAFLDLVERLPEKEQRRFPNLILTAPDIDSDIFRDQLVPRLTRLPTRITLYISANDEALNASRRFHNSPRIGWLPANGQPPILDGVETIDVSNVDSSFLGHSYYAEKRSVLEDMFHLLRNNLPASNRYGLKEIPSDLGPYWMMLPAGE